MNKQAAEKIASEYYALGVKLAQEKVANKAFQKTINALAGGGAGLYGASSLGGKLRGGLGGKSEYLRDIFAKGDATRTLDPFKAEVDSLLGKGFLDDVSPMLVPKMSPEELAWFSKMSPELKAIATLQGEGMSGLESVIDKIPELGLAAGIGTGVYKGLGKLDKKLKLY